MLVSQAENVTRIARENGHALLSLQVVRAEGGDPILHGKPRTSHNPPHLGCDLTCAPPLQHTQEL